MIRLNEDESYDPVAPFWVISRRGAAETGATAGPLQTLHQAVIVWCGMLGSGADLRYYERHIIYDAAGVGVLGAITVPHPRSKVPVFLPAVTPWAVPLMVEQSVAASDLLGMLDALADVRRGAKAQLDAS